MVRRMLVYKILSDGYSFFAATKLCANDVVTFVSQEKSRSPNSPYITENGDCIEGISILTPGEGLGSFVRPERRRDNIRKTAI